MKLLGQCLHITLVLPSKKVGQHFSDPQVRNPVKKRTESKKWETFGRTSLHLTG
jgi:hypothetical protein